MLEERAGTGTYNVRIYDEFDVNVLNALGDGLAVDNVKAGTLTRLLDTSDRPRPLWVAGDHVFWCDAADGSTGVFCLFYWPGPARRVDDRLVT